MVSVVRGGLTEGCSHGRVLHGWLAVSRGQVGPGEVTALLVVVLDVEAGEFGEADPQSAAAVVDVLSVQRLKRTPGSRAHNALLSCIYCTTPAEGVLTSLAAWADAPSGYCSRAWNWLFLVKTMILSTVPNFEKI